MLLSLVVVCITASQPFGLVTFSMYRQEEFKNYVIKYLHTLFLSDLLLKLNCTLLLY